ncbi:extracellular matrix protein fras1 [Plakobranchus ocellatus]|uniref:Extracellular matrix protein fras1 n=1 Tax=Plakobranchus ocellatus TaxID=259542 RepID=A0AAV4CMG2_9GAST|nr:extracellular matrix protein fras1 [Plakobranchus ocellatus]
MAGLESGHDRRVPADFRGDSLSTVPPLLFLMVIVGLEWRLKLGANVKMDKKEDRDEGPCVTESGVRMPDGSEWSPLSCVKCFCRDGNTKCLPVQCPKLQCSQDVQDTQVTQAGPVTLMPGQCCPGCLEQTCKHDGHTYREGEHWSPDACTYCACHEGQVWCRTLTCDLDPDCPLDEQSVRKHGECCPQCVHLDEICVMDGITRYHGDLWQKDSCEFCACQQGQVMCNVATCAEVTCTENELLLTAEKSGSCCPRCVKVIPCQVEGQTFQVSFLSNYCLKILNRIFH